MFTRSYRVVGVTATTDTVELRVYGVGSKLPAGRHLAVDGDTRRAVRVRGGRRVQREGEAETGDTVLTIEPVTFDVQSLLGELLIPVHLEPSGDA